MFIYINSLKPGRFGDSTIIIGIIFIVSIIFMLINSRLSMKLIIPIVLVLCFLIILLIICLVLVKSWIGINVVIADPNSKICKVLKETEKLLDSWSTSKKFNWAYGLLPKLLLILNTSFTNFCIGRIPVPGKVKGPRLPDCEFDPFAEARKTAEAAARPQRAAAAEQQEQQKV